MAKDIDYGPAFDVARKIMAEGIDPPSLQEELHRLYCRVITELEPRSLFDDDFQNAFQALSEAIESHGGGKHRNYLYEDDDLADCVIIGAGGEIWTGSMPSWD